MAADVGGALWMPLVIALVLALLTAGTYAELITKYPHAGGAARYAERAFGKPYVTFLIGFLMLASGITTSAALANAFAGDYLQALVDLPSVPVTLVFVATPGRDQPAGRARVADGQRRRHADRDDRPGHHHRGRRDRVRQRRRRRLPGDHLRRRDLARCEGAFAATITAFFSFLGFEAAANMAEEVKHPSRAYPRALFGAILTAGVVYLLIALGAVDRGADRAAGHVRGPAASR